MSKNNQVLDNLAWEELCTYFIVTSSRELASVNEGLKSMDDIIGPKQLQWTGESLFIISEKQGAKNVLVRSFKDKNFKKVFQFLSFNTGLVFVLLVAYYELNTSINS